MVRLVGRWNAILVTVIRASNGYRCSPRVLRLSGTVAAIEEVGYVDCGHSSQICLGGRSKIMSSSNSGAALEVAPSLLVGFLHSACVVLYIVQ